MVTVDRAISPEGSSSKHAQQGAIAADALIGEIGKCCRDLFTSSHKSEKKLPDAATGKAFRSTFPSLSLEDSEAMKFPCVFNQDPRSCRTEDEVCCLAD
uniref:Uncharacterized protein n=1 Tax=Parascaris equorum TaxID=6256 RepID=A0A914RUC1_PAREQ